MPPTDETVAARVARRFPLVARPRPPRAPVADRIAEIASHARRSADPTAQDPAALTAAAAAFNLAALLASDTGHPTLAAALCWEHHDLYEGARPLSALAARQALEPLVNLARLRTRSHDHTGAFDLLDQLHDAVQLRGQVRIGDRQLSFHDLTTTDTDHRTVCSWLWAVFLADGLRALTAAGRWADALDHARRHHGIGRRLLDGRQVAILAHCLGDDPSTAQDLLDHTVPAQPWEIAVASCLTVLCQNQTGAASHESIRTMIDTVEALPVSPHTRDFHTRLRAVARDLMGEPIIGPSEIDRSCRFSDREKPIPHATGGQHLPALADVVHGVLDDARQAIPQRIRASGVSATRRAE